MTEQEILAAVKNHHQLVTDKGFITVMTVLIGSQNYHLDIETSDIDTFTFFLPSFEDMAFAREPQVGEFEVSDGKCMYKDIRFALNLLKKTSPNSVECFIGQYRFFEPQFKDIFTYYLCDSKKLNAMIHCNYNHMLYAIAGMAHQLTKRNMSSGKRYSHAMRLQDMADAYLYRLQAEKLLNLVPEHLEEARRAKRDINTNYDQECFSIANQLDNLKKNFILSEYNIEMEQEGLKLVEQFQKDIFQRYIENNFNSIT